MLDKIFKKMTWDVVSLIGLLIGFSGIGILWLGPESTPYDGLSLGLGFVLTFVGAIVVGGLPSISKLLSKVKISIQMGLFIIGLILLFIQWKGTQYFIETSLTWILGAFVSTSIIWIVKWGVTTE